MSSDAIHSSFYTDYKFSYFTLSSDIAKDPTTGIYVDVQKYNPLDGASIPGGTQDFNLPDSGDVSLLGVSFSSIESATEDELAALAAPGVVEAFIDLGGNMITDTAPRPEIVDFKIVQDQPLIAGWSVLAHPLELEAYSARANQMQQPSFVRDLDSEFRDRDLFNSFRRCHSLIISGAPGFLEDGFLDPDSDFTYTNFRSLFGIAKLSSKLVVQEITPESFHSVAGRPASDSWTEHEMEYWDIQYSGPLPSLAQSNAVSSNIRTPDAAKFVYTSFTVQVDFEYLKSTNATTNEYSPYYGGGDWRDLHDNAVNAGTKPLNYKIAAARCSTERAMGTIIEPHYTTDSDIAKRFELAMADGDAGTGGSGIGASIGRIFPLALSEPEQYQLELRECYPKAYDGLEGKFQWHTGTTDTETIWRTQETLPDITDLPVDLGGADEGAVVDSMRSHHHAYLGQKFLMHWSNGSYVEGSPATDLHSRAYVNRRLFMNLYFGTSVGTIYNVYSGFMKRVRTLQDAWVYDDTALKTRIRSQSAPKIGPALFTSMDAGYVKEDFTLEKYTDYIHAAEQVDLGPTAHIDMESGEFYFPGGDDDDADDEAPVLDTGDDS